MNVTNFLPRLVSCFSCFLPLFFLFFGFTLDGFEISMGCGSSGSSDVLFAGVGTIGVCGTGVLEALRNVIRLAGGVLVTDSSTVSPESAPDSSNSGDFERVAFSNVASEIFNKSIQI